MPTRKTKAPIIFLSLLLISLSGGLFLYFSPDKGKSHPAIPTVTVITETGAHKFIVELAQTPAERAQGLMFRQNLPQNKGMLFDFLENQPLSFWMKNTYIPLDIIFIDENLYIVNFAQNTVPLSLKTIKSRRPARYVLEINAGLSQQIKLQPGNHIELSQ